MKDQVYHIPSMLLLFISIIIAVSGQFLFKNGAIKLAEGGKDFPLILLNPSIFFGMAAYFISAIMYVMVLRHIPLSVAYPSVSLSYIAVIIGGHFFFGEALTITKVIGTVFIMVGVVFLWK